MAITRRLEAKGIALRVLDLRPRVLHGFRAGCGPVGANHRLPLLVEAGGTHVVHGGRRDHQRVHRSRVADRVAGLERSSENPLARATVEVAAQRDISAPAVQDFESVTGKGVRGSVESRRVVISNPAMMAEIEADAGELQAMAKERHGRGEKAIFVAINGKAAGTIAIADPIKTTAEVAGC